MRWTRAYQRACLASLSHDFADQHRGQLRTGRDHGPANLAFRRGRASDLGDRPHLKGCTRSAVLGQLLQSRTLAEHRPALRTGFAQSVTLGVGCHPVLVANRVTQLLEKPRPKIDHGLPLQLMESLSRNECRAISSARRRMRRTGAEAMHTLLSSNAVPLTTHHHGRLVFTC
jgi:hypothetical protein